MNVKLVLGLALALIGGMNFWKGNLQSTPVFIME
jgi:hypothetical protein